MPIQAWGLVTLFTVCSVLLSVVSVRIAARARGPRSVAAYVLPSIAAFLAFYLIGHRLGLSVGPEVSLLGFQVALVGDLAIGFAAALIVAFGQALVIRARRGRAMHGAGPGV